MMSIYKFYHNGIGPLGGHIFITSPTESSAKTGAVRYIESTKFKKSEKTEMISSLHLLSFEPVVVNTVIDFNDGEY